MTTSIGPLLKSASGIPGFDEITGGGLPTERPTLVCGGPGSGKTLFAISFLVQGAVQFGEPGVFMSFEENTDELAQNVSSLGFDLPRLIADNKLALDYVNVERNEIEETGEYDLEGLFIRLAYAIDAIGAKRVVLDTIESLFGGLSNESVLRAELRRLFRWLKGRGVTTLITGERGDRSFTRQGLEEYVSDAVILLDHRVEEQISTRRIRIVKYRGTTHGTNEYPFLIDADGISVMPITSLGLDHKASLERISTGIKPLDDMLGGVGYFRGSTVLVSGVPGTGKTSMAASLVDAACRRGERCLYFLFEESPQQLIRNMRSIGVDLEPWVQAGLLNFHAARSSNYGLEMHLATMHRAVQQFRPDVAVVDPVTNLLNIAKRLDVQAMLARLIDHLKMEQITALFTSLTHGNAQGEISDVAISSAMDSWLLLTNFESGGERNRGIYVLKSRGMAHSNQIREFRLTSHGIDIIDVYSGPAGVLTGSARLIQEAVDQAAAASRHQAIERTHRELTRRRQEFESQVALLRTQFEGDEARLTAELSTMQVSVDQALESVKALARQRGASAEAPREEGYATREESFGAGNSNGRA